jgi:hypothetical protein
VRAHRLEERGSVVERFGCLPAHLLRWSAPSWARRSEYGAPIRPRPSRLSRSKITYVTATPGCRISMRSQMSGKSGAPVRAERA